MIFDFPKMLIQELGQSLQGRMKDDLSQSQVQSLLESALRKCNLVTREEFDAQKAVLLRTREKLEQLERQLTKLSEQQTPAAPTKLDVETDGEIKTPKPVVKPKSV